MIPASAGKAASSAWAKLWMVWMRRPPGASRILANSRRARCIVGGSLASPRLMRSVLKSWSRIRTQVASRALMRLAISAAPALVKVRHRICSGRTPDSSSRSTRAVSTCVLPLPADADSAAWTLGSDAARLVALELGKGLQPVAHQRPASQAAARGHRKRRMSDDDKDDEASEARRAKLVKAGVAVGIGSAAIVAALLYASKVKKPRQVRQIGSFAAVPFFQPHQLVVVAIGRVGRVQLGRERLFPGQPLARRPDEMPFGMGEELRRALMSCRDTLFCRSCRHIWSATNIRALAARPVTPSNPPALAISPSRPSCSANPASTAFCAGALPVL